MANPHFVFNEKEKWAEMLSKEKVFSFIHIPIQSGSNEVLKKMNRVGTAEQFEELANYLREIVENISIMTDIIAGFPEETEGDFEKTMELIEKARPDITNISMFYPRPETKAALMKKVPTDISKQRTRKLTELVKKISLEQNKKMINREIECLVTGKLDDGKTHSRSFNYKQVIFPEKKNGLVCVKITKATPDYLLGTLLNS